MQKFVQFPQPTPTPSGALFPDWETFTAPVEGRFASQVLPTFVTVQLAVAGPQVAETRERLHEIFRTLTRQPRRTPATEVRQRFSDIVTWTNESNRPVMITNHGKPEAIILSYETFERLVRGLAHAVLTLGKSQSPVRVLAEDILEEEGAALSRRLRHGKAE
jgi:prevent-host-death family protein